METYRDIPGYEGHYQVSDLGNVRSLKFKKEKVLVPITNKREYLYVSLCINKTSKIHKIHVLVAMAFLGFKPDGHNLVINHINFNKKDNRLINLEITTNRENCNMKHIPHSSKYTGVSWRKDKQKWQAEISINGKRKKLGYHKVEFDAHVAYEQELKKVI